MSTLESSLRQLAQDVGKPDLIVDATGSSPWLLARWKCWDINGVLVWTGITGGTEVTVPGDKINLEWVLGNKLLLGSVNANREHFEMGIKDLAQGEVMFPGRD